MTPKQREVAELAQAKAELGRQLHRHIGNCPACGNARTHRQPKFRCLDGREIAATLTAIKEEYVRAQSELVQIPPGQDEIPGLFDGMDI